MNAPTFTLSMWLPLAVALCLGGCGFGPMLLGERDLPYHKLDMEGRAHAPRPSRAVLHSEPTSRWRYIVIHHSATSGGNAAEFDRAHRHRGWDQLGYHFVITNGQGGPDGGIEVGGRWIDQKTGAHTGNTPGNEYNAHGIGICLVGDFDKAPPTQAQLQMLDEVVAELARRYEIPPERIIGHCDAPNAQTHCPGKWLESYIRLTLAPRAGVRLARR